MWALIASELIASELTASELTVWELIASELTVWELTVWEPTEQSMGFHLHGNDAVDKGWDYKLPCHCDHSSRYGDGRC